jgi:hypothetical protein
MKFRLRIILYIAASFFIHFALLLWLGGIGMANDISTEQRIEYSSRIIFVLKYILGFPFALFVDYRKMLDNGQLLPALLLFLSNAITQFLIIHFIARRYRREQV